MGHGLIFRSSDEFADCHLGQGHSPDPVLVLGEISVQDWFSENNDFYAETP